MKLLACLECSDVRALHREVVRCKCGASAGRYLEDGLNAEYTGEDAILLALDNNGLLPAIESTLKYDAGIDFDAWTLAEQGQTHEKVEEL